MKYLNKKKYMIAQAFSVLISVLLGIAPTVYAIIYLPYTFLPNTTISSSQVNNNFQELAQSMPTVKGAPGPAYTLSFNWQNITSSTLTFPVDGHVILFGIAGVSINQGSIVGGPGYGYSAVGICMTQTSGGGSPCNGAVVTFDTPDTGRSQGNYTPRLGVPITIIGVSPVAKNTPVTYYLTARKDSESVGTCAIDYSSLTAIFVPGPSLPGVSLP